MLINKPFVASFVFALFYLSEIDAAYMNFPGRFLALNLRKTENCRSSHNYCVISQLKGPEMHPRSLGETTLQTNGSVQLFQTVYIEAEKVGERVWHKADKVMQKAGKVKKELEESEELQEEVNQF